MSIARCAGLAFGLASSVAVFTLAAGDAHAQAAKAPGKSERTAAREAYDKGTAAFEKGDYVTALDAFVKANAIIPSVQAMFWIARSQDQAGKAEAAVEAYEAVLSRADFNKLSEDKQALVKERGAALKAQLAPPPAAEPPPPAAEPPPPAAEPLPEPPPAPPPTFDATPPPEPMPPADSSSDTRPKKNTAELGIMGGALFPAASHNLKLNEASHHELEIPAWEVGVRAAFFPERVFGVEAEYVHGFGKVKGGPDAQLDGVRGHLIGQLPSSRAVPFVALGAGILRADSGDSASGGMGADTDFDLEAGVGLKVMATKILVPRLDVRVHMTQKEGGGFTDGIAFHPEVLLGLSFTLGR